MILQIMLILIAKITELRSEKAFLFIPSLNATQDIINIANEDLYFDIILACPASTQQEKQFDEKVSLSGHSLFSRQFYSKHELLENIQQDICDKSFEPVMIYDYQRNEYKIGYELYYDEAKEPQFVPRDGMHYHNYRPIKIAENQTDYEIKNQLTSQPDFVMRYNDGHKLRFNFTDGSRTLVFHWVQVLNIKSSGYNKRITNPLRYSCWMFNLTNNCHYYRSSSDENIYSEQNQETYLKDILIPASVSEANHQNISCGQAYGCLVNSQIASLMYFTTNAERFASCTHINMIPVWKTIVEGQLEKVDAFVMMLDSLFISQRKIIGVSGALKMRKASNPNETREIYLSDPEGRKVIRVPKILYRIIEYHRLQSGLNVDRSQWKTHKYAAAIIIHNVPSTVPDDERLCNRKSALSGGWDEIINDDPRTGITYVCPVTPQLNEILQAYENITTETFQLLNVNAVPYSNSLVKWDPADAVYYVNYTADLHENYDEILASLFPRS